MDRLQVELEKAHKRITKAVNKRVKCDKVTVEYHFRGVTVYGWIKGDIAAALYMYTHTPSTKQIVHKVQHELDIRV